MGSINSQGVYEYDVTDDEIGPVLLNRQSAALTNLFTGRANTVRVANVSQRAAALADHGTPTTGNPLIVFRADAGAGRELEYTTDGVLWRTVPAEQDTGLLPIPGSGPAGWYQESEYRILNGWAIVYVHLRAASVRPAGALVGAVQSGEERIVTTSENAVWFTCALGNDHYRARLFNDGSINMYDLPQVSEGQQLRGTVTYPVG